MRLGAVRATETREHLAIVEALLAGDARGAARAMARHIRSGARYWSRSLPNPTNGDGQPTPSRNTKGSRA